MMKIEQKMWTSSADWKVISSTLNGLKPQFVFAFGDRLILDNEKRFEELRKLYPQSSIILASTSGNILGVNVFDQSIVTTAVALESSRIEIQRINISDVKNSFEAGEIVATKLSKKDLKHVFILSDGHIVNGSELIKGILTKLPPSVALTGGLAGDGKRFEKTLVGVDAPPKEGEIVLIGFYGPNLKFGFGSVGGWDSFGIERKITRSSGNILYELDGKSALELYKTYLREYVKDLPASALLFPLAIRANENSIPLVRTILSINEQDQSMIFAGDIPQGWRAQLMKANFDRLIDGAFQAANASHEMLGKQTPELAILVSCVGRIIVLDQRVEEELESVQDVIGKKAIITGFYSYGEISPVSSGAGSDLHNQTMTITTISEK
jgi:hypothetical protein